MNYQGVRSNSNATVKGNIDKPLKEAVVRAFCPLLLIKGVKRPMLFSEYDLETDRLRGPWALERNRDSSCSAFPWI